MYDVVVWLVALLWSCVPVRGVRLYSESLTWPMVTSTRNRRDIYTKVIMLLESLTTAVNYTIFVHLLTIC